MLKLRFANKEHGDVWLVEPSVLLGTDSSCQVVMKSGSAQPRHAEIQIKGAQLVLVNLAADAGVRVNGAAVGKSVNISVGDKLLIAGVEMVIVDPKDERAATPAAPESSGWAIRPNHSALANRIYSINGDTVVGRATECDLSFSVAHMSRKHAQLSILNGQLIVKDLESANGTFVNGTRVSEAKLNRGDELRLDQLSFTVIGPGGEADKTTVRSAITPMAVPTQPAATASSKPTPVATPAPEREKKRAAGTTSFYKAVNASQTAQTDVASSTGLPKGAIIAAVLVLVLVGVAITVLDFL